MHILRNIIANKLFFFFFLRGKAAWVHFQNQDNIQVSVSGGLVITALPLFLSFFFKATPGAYGGSQARG